MVIIRPLLIGLAVAVWAILAGPTSAADDAAGQSARLDSLFAELQSTNDALRGQAVTAEIWQLWLKSGRDDVDTLIGQATTLMAAGELVAARGILDGIVERAPGYAEGWNKRATVLYMLGEHELSLADIDTVLKLEPRHFGALAGQGLIHMTAERWKPALAAFRKAVAINPFLAERHTMIPFLERKVEGVPL